MTHVFLFEPILFNISPTGFMGPIPILIRRPCRKSRRDVHDLNPCEGVRGLRGYEEIDGVRSLASGDRRRGGSPVLG